MGLLQVSDLQSDGDKQAVLDTLAQTRRDLRYWRGQAGVDEGEPVPDSPGPPRKLPPLREDVPLKYSRTRANGAGIAICEVVERLPVREQALALDKAIRKLGPEVQAAVSALPFARQEQFLGARRALNKQQIVPTQ